MIDKLITEISIDLYGETKEYLVSAKQNDKNTRQIRVTLLNNGVPYEIPSDCVLIINIKKPDGKYVYNQCYSENNVVVVDLTNQMLAASGTATADINIKTADNTQILSSASFTIEIEPSMYDDSTIMSSNEMNMLDAWIAQTAEQEAIRVQAEKERIEAEKIRKQNESERISAESERIKRDAQLQNTSSQAIENVEKATANALDIIERGENALYNQALLEQTTAQVTNMCQVVEKDTQIVTDAKEKVLRAEQSVNDKIENASLEASKQILDEVQRLANQIEEQYNLLYVSADGGTPTSIDYITIDGGTPMSVDTIDIDCGNPYSI